MLRLARKGEAWAESEVEDYRTKAETPRTMWGSIQVWLLEAAAHRPRPRLVQIRKACANDCGLTVTEFLRTFPRFDREWAKAKKEALIAERGRASVERAREAGPAPGSSSEGERRVR